MSNKDLIGISANPYRTAFLTNLVYPSGDGGWRDVYRSGWLPGWFNQQWGGAQVGHEIVDAATGVLYKFEPATGNVQDDSTQPVDNVGSNSAVASKFRVSENISVAAIWVKAYKVGNPATTFTAVIQSSLGSNVGVGGTINGKQFTSNTNGEWYRIPVTGVNLVANTDYYFSVDTSAGTADASNYVTIKAASTGALNAYVSGFIF